MAKLELKYSAIETNLFFYFNIQCSSPILW